MIKFEHRGSKVNSGDLRTPISFYEATPSEGPEAGESATQIIYECFAEVQKVWRRDMDQAKTNNTLDDITIKIRDPYETFTPNNKQYIGINDRNYFNKQYNVKSVQPDTQNAGFILIIAELVT